MDDDPNDLGFRPAIKSYREAFSRANGKPPPPITYRGNGWYSMEGHGRFLRLRDFVAMADRLNKREPS